MKIILLLLIVCSSIVGMNRGAVQTDGMNRGAVQYDVESSPPATCDTLIIFNDTTFVKVDAAAWSCSTQCADTSGTVYHQWSRDTTDVDSTHTDSTTGVSGIALVVDTTGQLSPSTEFYLRNIFTSSGGGSDTTNWYTFTTKDSVLGGEWLYWCGLPEIDSLSDSSLSSGTQIVVYGFFGGGTGSVYLDDSIQVVDSWDGPDSITTTLSHSVGNHYLYVVDSCSNNSDSVQITIEGYTITLQNDGNGTTSPATDTTVVAGTAANLVATPTGNNTFLYWTTESGTVAWGDSTSAATTCTLSTDVTVKAWFLPKYTLTNSVNVTGYGTPSVASALVDSAADTTVTFTGTDSTALDSIQITSGTIDTAMTNDSVIVVTVHSDAGITAYYSLTTYAVTLTSDTHAALDTLNNGPWVYGSVCSVSVDLDAGYAGKMNAGASFYNDTTFVFTVQSDTTFQVVDYLIPVIDSIRNLTALRDSVWVQSARIGDTLRIYGSGLYGSGSEAYVANQSSTGNTVFDTLGVPTDDSLDVTPDAASISGFFRSWISTRDGIVGTPKSRAVFIKKFYGE